jgi:hypothetical protein
MNILLKKTGRQPNIKRDDIMMKKSALFVLTSIFALGLGVLNAKAVQIMKTATVDGLRLELHAVKAEPFYTVEQVKANPKLQGMLIIGGAKPLAPDAKTHPNCHLIVHVFNAKTGKPLSKAKVSMTYQAEAQGKAVGVATKVPVVVMQVIGKGPISTHYGNNVVLPDGTYVVTVVANGKKAVFHINVKSISSGSDHDN